MNRKLFVVPAPAGAGATKGVLHLIGIHVEAGHLPAMGMRFTNVPVENAAREVERLAAGFEAMD